MGDIKVNDIEIFNETNIEIKELEILDGLTKYMVKYMNVKNALFNVIIVDNKRIHEINKEYRGIDRETDVISFALEDDQDIVIPNIRFLGDIYISIDKARMQANEYGHTLKRELSFLTVHGFLHLLGYDHMKKSEEEIMFKLQEEILDSYGISRKE